MMRVSPISLPRRLAIAFASLALSALLFRGQVATALIARGDEFLQRGRVERASHYYLRALVFDRRSALAADRAAFAGILLRTPRALTDAIDAASLGLANHPDDPDLLADRGLCYQLEHHNAEASRDFARAARLKADARLYHFAAWNALRSGNAAAARAFWRAALSADAEFIPARLALDRAEHAR